MLGPGQIGRVSSTAAATFVALSLVVTPFHALALGRDLHKCVANGAAHWWSFPALVANLQAITDGAKNEDEVDHLYPHYCVGLICYQTCTHFWDPDGPLDATPIYDSNSATYCVNAWTKANELLDQAVLYYWLSRDPAYEQSAGILNYWAWEFLGHVTHLIGDVSVPAHVHVDLHTDEDTFDDSWIGNSGAYLKYCMEEGPPTISFEEGGGFLKLPAEAIGFIMASGDSGFDLPPSPEGRELYAKLFYLMYTSAQRADVFASDDYDGDASGDWFGVMAEFPPADADCGRPGVPFKPCYPRHALSPRTKGDLADNRTDPLNDADGDYSRISESCMLQSMRSVATFYRAFRDAVDRTAPVTTVGIGYAYPPGPSGWTRGGVTLHVAATDENTGVYRTFVQEEGDAAPAVVPANGFVTWVADGTHEVAYWSQDWFGNLEEPGTVVLRIDGTPPVIEWTSPAESLLYLSDGTLTIDWSATDGGSGVAHAVATLDDVPVFKGQTLDLSRMAGTHTFVLEVADRAGNVASATVAVVVTIAAEVDLDPDRINAKNPHGAVTAYVEFAVPYPVGRIDLSTVRIAYGPARAAAAVAPTAIVDRDRDGLAERMVRFERAGLLWVLREGGLPTGLDHQWVEVIVRGELADGTPFRGTDVIGVARF